MRSPMARRLMFLTVLIILVGVAWWVFRGMSELARARDALKAVPERVSVLAVPLSAAWDATFKLPGQAADLERYGVPVTALGQQADGTLLALGANGTVEVTLPQVRGADQQPGRLLWLPSIDLEARLPLIRIHDWRCLALNLPEIAQTLPACRNVDAAQLGVELAAHQNRLEQWAQAAQSTEAPASTIDAMTEQLRREPLPVTLSPDEVERALRAGQTLEQALAEKKRLLTPPEATPVPANTPVPTLGDGVNGASPTTPGAGAAAPASSGSGTR